MVVPFRCGDTDCTHDPAERGEARSAFLFGYFFGISAAGFVVLGGALAVFGGE